LQNLGEVRCWYLSCGGDLLGRAAYRGLAGKMNHGAQGVFDSLGNHGKSINNWGFFGASSKYDADIRFSR